ncbi:glycerol-3-phosphate cytidylyltransferase [Mesobacillus maritimus]|uniref:glycerol-3-phosphate cytidylyltransferase n=1 Tax=Mesobacillus maritimus TaxID=1643336 RepID=UPI00203D0224|nr:glycerol-3-phosphate cytidylyltransferase [Mesobacillus maritimus]MCM3668081.1 glycerol-3-phosphate cytidylyltransferase [Mesobacillus maritimus]
MKKVLTYGTFDLLHFGHINLLQRAKDLGDHLTVGLSTDEFNAGKNKKAYHSFENRKLILESIRFVDKVIPENTWDQKIKDVIENNIDIFVMGDDWEGKFDFLKEYCEVIYLPRTIGISTTQIKEDLNSKVKNG